MDGAVLNAQGNETEATAGIVHHQIDREVLDKELNAELQRLAIEAVQHSMTGTVGSRAAAPRGLTLAELAEMSAERPLIDLAIVGAGEWHAVMLEFQHRLRRAAAQQFDGVLVAQPVGADDGVVHVPAPVVRPLVAERR